MSYLARTILFAATSAAAMSAPALAASAFSGPYLGVGVKTGFLKTSASATNSADGAYQYGSGTAASQSKTNFAGDLLAGCGWDLDDFFVGVEAMVSLGNAKNNQIFQTTVNSYSVLGSLNVGTRFGLAGRLGYVFTPSVLGYVGLGAQVARVTTGWSDAYLTVNNNSPATSSVAKTIYAFAPTVGVEAVLFDSTTARLEYTYIKYPTQNCKASDTTSSTLSVSPKEHQLRLALIWRF